MKKPSHWRVPPFVDPEVLIYDEPTTGLDPMMMAKIDDMIRKPRSGAKWTSIVISHDMASTFRIAHSVAMLTAVKSLSSLTSRCFATASWMSCGASFLWRAPAPAGRRGGATIRSNSCC